MAEPKPPTHLEAEDILLAMDTAPNIEEHVRRLLLYIRAAEQTEKERDKLRAKLAAVAGVVKAQRESGWQLAWIGDIEEALK